MRRQILLLVSATTSLVIIAFLVPFAYLIREVTADRAARGAGLETQQLAAFVGEFPLSELRQEVDRLNREEQRRTTVFLADGTTLGIPAPRSPSISRAQESLQGLSNRVPEGEEILIPVQGRQEGTAVIRVLIPDEQLQQGVLRSWAILAGLGLALLLLAVLVADRLARAFIRPMSQLAATASRLEAGDLQARAEPAGPPEIHEVGAALNRLAERIDALLAAEREATADLSHRLRTPVTALRLDAESLRDSDERARLSADADELERMVDDLIREARRPVREGVRASCDAVAVVVERTQFWSVLAEEQGRQLSLRLPVDPIVVRASHEDLAAALDSLLGNVFAHTEEGVRLGVDVVPIDDGGTHIIVWDAGTGFPGDEVLQRGESRGGSTGLGLDIARRTAEASGGRMLVARSRHGGAEITLELGPAA